MAPLLGADRGDAKAKLQAVVDETLQAPAAEQAYRNNSRRGQQNAYVTIRIRNGDAALEQLYIDNQPLADYLRAQAAKK